MSSKKRKFSRIQNFGYKVSWYGLQWIKDIRSVPYIYPYHDEFEKDEKRPNSKFVNWHTSSSEFSLFTSTKKWKKIWNCQIRSETLAFVLQNIESVGGSDDRFFGAKPWSAWWQTSPPHSSKLHAWHLAEVPPARQGIHVNGMLFSML